MPAIQMESAVLEHLHTVTGVAPAWCTNEIFAIEGLEAVKIEFDVAYEPCSVRLLRPPSTPRRFLEKIFVPPTSRS
ncbi:hypothetical protein HAX54_025643 [Datura stramonium]|uniref:Uncharacterized protein n=1 Tax=Datura stramonium TaxID=4076 RepID=A0ABS8V038_DATST|nr:hypothetical protein [Datura stramonium]